MDWGVTQWQNTLQGLDSIQHREKKKREENNLVLVCSMACVCTGMGAQEENKQGVVAHDCNPS